MIDQKQAVCPRRTITAFSELMLDFHKFYQAGNLAVAGGVTDQPGIYLDAMATIDQWTKNFSADR